MKGTREKRKWFRVSLRMFLVVTLATGSLVGYLYNSVDSKRRAHADLVENGFVLAFDRESVYRGWVNMGFGGGVISLVERPTGEFLDTGDKQPWLGRFGLQLLANDVVYATAARSWLDKEKHPGLSDVDIEPLVRLRKIQELNLAWNSITDSGLADLSHLKQLEWLSLAGTDITDDGLKHLAGLTRLKYLSLADTKVTDAGLESLRHLTSLESLVLKSTEITGSGLVHLDSLSNLESLDLSRTQFQNRYLDDIGRHSNLVDLDLSRTLVDDSLCRIVKHMKMLKRLSVNYTAIGDSLILAIGPRKMVWLSVDATNVTDASVETIRQMKISSYFSCDETKISHDNDELIYDEIEQRLSR